MKLLGLIFILLCAALAQKLASPVGNQVEWNSSGANAMKELQDGRLQRTARTSSATVSIISDVVPARRFIDPPASSGPDITYIVIGIRNTSQQSVHIDPNTIRLTVVGKKEDELKRLTEEKVIGRAWQTNDHGPSALPAMSGSASGGRPMDASTAGPPDSSDTARGTATTNREQDRSNRRLQEASEKQTGAQTAALRDKALLDRTLDPGEQVMGLVFFYPYEKNDKLELSVPVGATTFVFPFSGARVKR